MVAGQVEWDGWVKDYTRQNCAGSTGLEPRNYVVLQFQATPPPFDHMIFCIAPISNQAMRMRGESFEGLR